MRINLFISDKLGARIRKIASRRHTSVAQLVREYLEPLASTAIAPDREARQLQGLGAELQATPIQSR